MAGPSHSLPGYSASSCQTPSSTVKMLAENDFNARGGDGYLVDIGSGVTRELLDRVTAAYVTANSLGE